MPPDSFIVQDCFDYPGFSAFPYEVEYRSFKVLEEFCWDFNGHCVESVDCFWLPLDFKMWDCVIYRVHLLTVLAKVTPGTQ